MKKILIRMALAALLVGIGIAGKPCNADSCIAKPSIGRDIIMCCKGFYIDLHCMYRFRMGVFTVTNSN